MTDGTIGAARPMQPRTLFERMAQTQRLTDPVECGCVPGHRMLVLTDTCADCGLTEREVAEGLNRPCIAKP